MAEAPTRAPRVSKKNKAPWILAGAIVGTLALYVAPYGRYVAYPLLLLSTYAHEMGHGLTALLVGGTFESLVIFADGSGVAYLGIPDSRLARAATSAGGLVGPALLAAVFFWLAKRPKTAHAGLMIFGVASLVALVLVVRNPVGWFLVGALGAGSVVLAVKSSPHAAQVVLAFMAVQLSLSVFSRGDYLFTQSTGVGPSDVAQMAEALWLPYWFWGFVCGAISVAVLMTGMRSFLQAAPSG